MEHDAERYTDCELCVLCLVAECLHSRISAYRTAQKGNEKKILLGNTPLAGLGIKLVKTIHCKCQQVHNNKKDENRLIR